MSALTFGTPISSDCSPQPVQSSYPYDLYGESNGDMVQYLKYILGKYMY